MAHTGEEFENPVSGERSVVRQGSDDTDGELVVADLYLRPGAGGPREHAHSYLHETFEILDGRVGFRLNGHQEVTGPGRKLVVEPGMVHDFWNAGEQEAHVLVEVRPGCRFEQMIQTVWGMAAAGETDARGRLGRCCGWRWWPRSSSGSFSSSRPRAGCRRGCSRCWRRSAGRWATRRSILDTWSWPDADQEADGYLTLPVMQTRLGIPAR